VKKGGSVAVSARTLFDIVKNLPEGDIEWSVGDNHAVEIRCGKVRYKIPGMPGEDFPPLPAAEDTEFSKIKADTLGELIALTQYSMSSDDTRPYLSGALFEGDGKVVRMVTTDGHRLSKAESKTGATKEMLNFSMLVPNKGVAELKRLIEDAKSEKSKKDKEKSENGASIEIATSGGQAFFRRAGTQLSVKLADEQFPPYSKVIPSAEGHKVVIARLPLMEALKRIALVANDRSGGVRLQLEPGMMRITSENPDVGEGSEDIEVDYASEPVVIGFNAKYLLDVLGALPDDEVVLEVTGELDPGVIKPAGERDFIGVIMPMRI
jgi:DNA polymerase-3 subunit beta